MTPPPGLAKTHAATALETQQSKMEVGIMDAEDIHLEIKLQAELHEACRQESDWWKIKSRRKWLRDGDRNTNYFHKLAEVRKNYNHVTKIQTTDRMITNYEAIKIEASKHFHDLFTA